MFLDEGRQLDGPCCARKTGGGHQESDFGKGGIREGLAELGIQRFSGLGPEDGGEALGAGIPEVPGCFHSVFHQRFTGGGAESGNFQRLGEVEKLGHDLFSGNFVEVDMDCRGGVAGPFPGRRRR